MHHCKTEVLGLELIDIFCIDYKVREFFLEKLTDLYLHPAAPFGKVSTRMYCLWLPSVIQVDGMDNSKSYLPRFLEKTKENQGTERLPSKISGCIIYSGYYEHKRKIMFYINHDQVFVFYSLSYNGNLVNLCQIVLQYFKFFFLPQG